MKKTNLLILATALLFASACSVAPKVPAPETQFDKSQALVDSESKSMSSASSAEIIKAMTTGWNLGNTFDATGTKNVRSEMSWGQPRTTKAMIEALAASGIKSIRIPISWHNHLIDKNYTIDPKWMTRVKEVVDWAIGADMYVIINSHHDCNNSPSAMRAGNGYYPNTTNYEESKRFLENIWTQIGMAFNNGYDEHLIFETMNEPRLCGTGHEWWFDPYAKECQDAAENLNKLNQDTLNAIRATGGNNEKRLVACPGLQASPDSALADEFKMPEDIVKERLIVSVHMYSPYNFAMESPGATKYTKQMKNSNALTFKRLNDKFVSKGYPVYVGEYGATNKNNLEDRVAWFTDFISDSGNYGIPCFLWDNGVWEVKGKDYNEHYGYYNRNEQTWFFLEILDAIVAASKN